ncbi:C40 family peptidase [Mycolicibacterium aubagnense]|uniref:NlpC/P60 domain-containing protein n=1 Tax=Mycolicibacterium aubagnense TaxID=319707 RepID=A0ABM7IMH4_9MYCO|nr:NlpC/P60 family protein [Mycolicibacterium aubagnense]TLH64279.1 hydrolase [Mycolicibacterium aubagnense]BBX87926.1 hypothetical protein MAUB_57990 [Mycolicibacterium aubagnense]
MTSSISTNDAVIQAGTSSASGQLSAARIDGKPSAPGVDPRLTGAVDDTTAQTRKASDKASDSIDKTSKDSKGKTAIDKGGADGLNGISGAMLGALGAGASSLLGAAGQGGGGMPQMPQVPASSAGQSNPGALSNPKAAQEIAKLLGGDGSSALGTGGLTTASGHGGGSGTAGPNSPGSTQYQQRIIDLARQVVAAGIPYSWGSGDLNGPTCSGNTSNAAANAAGDYNKTGFDCSGLARYLVYQASGVELPRVSGDQYTAGHLVSAADAVAGDLAFPTDPNEHVQVYVGDGKVVEAQQSGTDVMFSNARPGTQFVRVVSDV